MINGIFLLLGGNLGNTELLFKQAIQKMKKNQEIKLVNTSSYYLTAAWGKKDQPDFLNQVVQIHTSLPPTRLLKFMLIVEEQLGRKRNEKWGPRLIDIDLLYFNQSIINKEGIQVPHPEIPNRRFTLAPLAELAPDFIHPIIGKSQQELLALCNDPLPVEKIS